MRLPMIYRLSEFTTCRYQRRGRAASVGFPNILLCQSKYQLKLQPPFTPGMNLAGEIAALGEAAPG
jgi:NADPH2:quinone reductase